MRTSDRVTKRVDVSTLEARARASSDGEAYVQVFRSDIFRIGVTAIASETDEVSFSIEVLFTSTGGGQEELLSSLNDLTKAVKLLTEKGYFVDQQGDGWLIAWKRVAPTKIDDELSQLEGIIKNGARQTRGK